VVLVDSSVWILAEKGLVIAHQIPAGERLATCPIIVHEVLRGTETPVHYDVARRILLAVQMLDAPTPFARFEEAARLYLQCRDDGVTPRSTADCLVAVTALAHGALVLHNDRDFDHIARVFPLRTQRVTRS
jgi:predicted nucleic acid-binding protein